MTNLICIHSNIGVLLVSPHLSPPWRLLGLSSLHSLIREPQNQAKMRHATPQLRRVFFYTVKQMVKWGIKQEIQTIDSRWIITIFLWFPRTTYPMIPKYEGQTLKSTVSSQVLLMKTSLFYNVATKFAALESLVHWIALNINTQVNKFLWIGLKCWTQNLVIRLFTTKINMNPCHQHTYVSRCISLPRGIISDN